MPVDFARCHNPRDEEKRFSANVGTHTCSAVCSILHHSYLPPTKRMSIKEVLAKRAFDIDQSLCDELPLINSFVEETLQHNNNNNHQPFAGWTVLFIQHQLGDVMAQVCGLCVCCVS